MLSKSILKYIQSLHHKKFRDEYDVFIAETPKVVSDLLLSGKFVCELICAAESFLIENEKALLRIDEKQKLAITGIELEKISLLRTPNKVLAVFKKKEPGEVILQNKINLLLDDIRDPGNFGTIIRIADWFNIGNIICSEDSVEQYNPRAVQASMGSLAAVNVIYTDLEHFIKANNRINVYAATLNGKSLHFLNNKTEALVLIGNESKGVKEHLLKLAADQVTIPRFGKAESLNAAVATGIILSHLVK